MAVTPPDAEAGRGEAESCNGVGEKATRGKSGATSTQSAPTRIAEYARWTAERVIGGLHDTGKRVGVVMAAQEAARLDLGTPAADRGQGVVVGVDGVQVNGVDRTHRVVVCEVP